VRPADQKTIYAAQLRELTADPAQAARALGLGQSLPLPKGVFDLIPVGGLVVGGGIGAIKYLFPAECYQAGKLCIAGRVAFDEPRGCTSPVFSQQVSWSDCHSFKRHFDAAGNAITGAAQPAQMLRPLAGTVEVRYSVKWPMPGFIGSISCGSATVQTDAAGYFLAVVNACNKPGLTGVAKVTYTPVYKVPGSTGTIRTIWPVNDAKSVVPSDQVGSAFWTYTDPNTNVSTSYSLPTLSFSKDLGAEPQTSDTSVAHSLSAGTAVLLPAAAGDTLNYTRQALAAHENLVELHLRLQAALKGSSLDYNKMFVSTPWASSYTIYLNATWAFGGLGGISLLHPYADAVNHLNLLSDTAVDSHEFSHSVHSAFAATTLQYDYDFANKLTRANGQEYDWGHAGGQYQELGVGLTEGFASGFGQSLLNTCGGWIAGARPMGGADPFDQNMWNGVKTCDANDGCNFHHFRWQMVKRGVSEGSSTWSKRLTALQQLSQQLTTAGHRRVTSNSEDRVAELFCDLLDKSSDVSHAPAAGQFYWPSFTGTVGSILDGAYDNLLAVFIVSKQFSASGAENVSLSAPTLISSLGSFCPNGCQQTWTYGSAYTKDHLSTATGKLAPQRLLRHLVDTGKLTQADGANLLRTNWMEDSL